MQLNHLLAPCHDKVASANYFARMMGLSTGPVGHFARQHYAFKVTESEFEAIFGRVLAEGLRYGSGPGKEHLYDMQVDQRRGGRRVYFDEMNGHSIEIFTA